MFKIKKMFTVTIQYSLVVRMSGFHPGDSGSIPGIGISINR